MPKVAVLKRWHDISEFVSQDEARWVLNGVHLNVAKKRLEATDGRSLILVPVAIGEDHGESGCATDTPDVHDCIIPLLAFKDAMSRLGRARKGCPPVYETLFICGDANKDRVGLITHRNGQRVVAVCSTIDGNWPDLDSVSNRETHKFNITLHWRYLEKLAKAVKRQGLNEGVTLYFEDHLTSAYAAFRNGERQDGPKVVIMPMKDY